MKQFVVFQTNRDGADSIERELRNIADARCQIRQVQGQGGAPNVWSVVAEMTLKSLGALAAPLIALLGKGDTVISVDHPKAGKITCRTVAEFERIMEVINKLP